MGYTALYRKFRPDSFASVKGQDHIVKTLKNQIMADRIGHAYLFCGTRGTGKTTVAKILAKAVNCEHPVDGNPCGECETCKAIAAGTSMNVIEIDAASNNGVDNIREIREEVAYSPTTGKYKVYIIDEVHMLSIGAFNALLKTLEEPPSYVIFILATTEAHKIPITILSRCQRYDFKRISINTISSRLMELMEKENVEVEERAIRYIAKKADGSMRDALSLLDQCIAFYLGQKLTYDHVLDVLGAVDTEVFSRFLREILKNDVAQVMKHLEELVMQGRELGQFVSDFTWYLRNLLLLKSSEELEEVLDVSSDNLVLLKEEAGMVREDTLIRFIRVFSELSGQMKFSGSKRVLLEVALIKLCRPQMETDEVSLLERIRMLEKKLESGMIAVRQTPPGQRMQVPDHGTGEDAFFGGLDIPGDGNGASGMDALSFEEKAAPEDLQRVMSMWPSIVAQTTGRFKMTLISAVPKYNAAGEDNRLFVVFSDFMGERYANDPEAKKQLETIISGRLGKEVEVKMVLPDEEHLAPGRLAKINVSDGLSKIHADIEIEE
ncbi:DNA polymerase III subunit gamma/tau [Blautia sp. OF03-15BH]|uniref:DNA polymerase III subunit gamma/tau n=1 Tax=Blautia sp. OF03-15BH TaxID=2292287 RepID=UPI000E4B2200|nr:DNA polymerase III subunit gamma/tau [Blautia sp. OF03-15BH]RGY00646.1 DNA polymerase III subunit gamma/tau [Blautia sp. OF03-15BH]